MNEQEMEQQIKSLTGLVNSVQLTGIVSEMVSLFNGKIAELNKKFEDLGGFDAEQIVELDARIRILENRNTLVVKKEDESASPLLAAEEPAPRSTSLNYQSLLARIVALENQNVLVVQ